MVNEEKEYRAKYKGIKSLIRKVKKEEPHLLSPFYSDKYKKKVCDITGLPAMYSCSRTGLNYFNRDVYEYIRGLKAEEVQLYLDLKNFGKKLQKIEW